MAFGNKTYDHPDCPNCSGRDLKFKRQGGLAIFFAQPISWPLFVIAYGLFLDLVHGNFPLHKKQNDLQPITCINDFECFLHGIDPTPFLLILFSLACFFEIRKSFHFLGGISGLVCTSIIFFFTSYSSAYSILFSFLAISLIAFIMRFRWLRNSY